MTACIRGLAALIGVLGLFLVTGCSAQTATGHATQRSSSCVPPAFNFSAPRPPLPKELSTPLEATILSSFAIFRRPALSSDEPPGLNPAGGLRHELYKDYELSSYYPAYVRELARLPDGRRDFVIPAFGRPEALPPAHCFPGGERRGLLEQEHRRSVQPVYCIIDVGGKGDAPVPGCEPFAQINESAAAFHVSDFLSGEPTTELVPDGIGSVRITYRDTAPVVAHVNENAFVLTPPPAPHDRLYAYLRGLLPRLTGQHGTKTQLLTATNKWNRAFTGSYPTRIEWLDSTGRLVRALGPPTAKSNSTTSVGNLRAPLESRQGEAMG